MSTSELAVTYAALILHDEKIAITADKLSAILKAANVTVEAYWPALFAKLLATKNIGDLISNVGSGGAFPSPALLCVCVRVAVEQGRRPGAGEWWPIRRRRPLIALHRAGSLVHW